MSSNEISPLDLAFLCLERDDAPMHIGAVAVFETHRRTRPARLARMITRRAQRSPRLRTRARVSWFPPGYARWEEQPGFRAEDHVHAHHLPQPGGRAELAALVSELAAEPLDLSRPPWAAHLITGLDGDRFAVMMKLHHALADGAGALELGLGLLDGFTPAPQLRSSGQSMYGLAREALGMLRQPERVWRTVHAATRHASETMDIASALLRHVRLPELGSPMTAPACPAKRVELLPLRMQDLVRIRRHHGGTTNDVLLAVVTGALRRWLTTRGHPIDDLTLRALVPVNHGSRARDGAGNRLSGYLCDLPVGEPDPVRRLDRVREAMHRNKSAGPLRGPGAFPILAQRVLPAVHRVATPVVGRGASLLFDTLVTNVPLPNIPVYLDSSRLVELYPLAPLAAGHALSVAASQYGDTLHIGLQVNRSALPDVEKLTDGLAHAVAELDDAAS